MKVAWNLNYCYQLPVNHRFPMGKYRLLPQQLVYEGTINRDNLFGPTSLREEHILAVHEATYWHKLKHLTLSPREQRRTGFPLSHALINRETTIAQGTLEASEHALREGIAFNIAGGTHHAGRDFGEGFCLLNDIAIAARYLVSHNLANKILIIDLDVHQGNGTAHIFMDDDNVSTFSMHGAKNFPMEKVRSDLDVALPDHTGDRDYLELLEYHLEEFCHQQNAEVIFYQAGVDVLETDMLGRLSLSMEGCRQRDRLVMEFCRQREIALVVVMGGGYSPKMKTIIEAHANTFRTGYTLYG